MYHSRGIVLNKAKDSFLKVDLEITFEDFNHPQKVFLFELLDKRFEAFKGKEWYEFNSLTYRYFNEEFKSMELPAELEFLRSNEFLNTTENIIEDRRKEIIALYEEMRDNSIYEIFADVEPSYEIEEYEEENRIYSLFDEIRNKEYTYLELYNVIKRETELDKEALQYLKKDIELYLFITKDIYGATFLQDDIDRALKILENQGNTNKDLLEKGYLKENKLSEKTQSKDDKPQYRVNVEKLMFPTEFLNIYSLKNIVNSELEKLASNQNSNENAKTSIPKLQTSLSVPQIALLFKMINDLKPSIFKVNSEAELHRFISANFQTKSSDPEKGISENKLRILFNQPDSKAIEFWEKHLRTMLAEIKKLK
ncbi:hypothetical protein KZY98_11980 [Croceibacter atlanticus]|uniref:hypothetical protein n=1 Tax=Croceibacter atlanticus TaxID=313588 RepID=UPI001C5D079C|nr:hypothetical protein [Croceibacter atlanticus]MBW4971182.1 hypothetical protein [Croceibacter atlanticus]